MKLIDPIYPHAGRWKFYRRIIKRETYAAGEGTISTMECGHTNSGPTATAGEDFKPCLTCERLVLDAAK